MKPLFTIGYEHSTAGAFFGALTQAGVGLVVDVRARRLGRAKELPNVGHVVRGPSRSYLRHARLGQHVEPEPQVLLLREPFHRRRVAVTRSIAVTFRS